MWKSLTLYEQVESNNFFLNIVPYYLVKFVLVMQG